eukprot:2348741-Pyramimonas_sp.AAC.1
MFSAFLRPCEAWNLRAEDAVSPCPPAEPALRGARGHVQDVRDQREYLAGPPAPRLSPESRAASS